MVVPDKTILFAVIFIKESNGEESQDLSTICSQILSNYFGGKNLLFLLYGKRLHWDITFTTIGIWL